MSRVAIIGGGISGLAAAYRLHKLAPSLEIALLERDTRFGGKLLTEQIDDFIIEGAPDSFLARKPRGVALCEELGIAHELYGRDPNHADKTSVKWAGALYPLPAGLSGMIPTDLDALANNPLISAAGRERLAQEITLPPAPPNGDESLAAFVTRRLGREVYEKLVEPLMSGIYAGDGEQLSLAATFPQLRQLELQHGSLLKGLMAAAPQSASKDSAASPAPAYPPFVALRAGMGTLVDAIVAQLPANTLHTGVGVTTIQREPNSSGYTITLDTGETLVVDALIITTPAYVTAQLVDALDPALATAHAAIPYASSAIVSLAYDQTTTVAPVGYGYVIPRTANSDVLACTCSSNKWSGRAPEGTFLVRVYLGRYGQRDVTQCNDQELITLARQEVRETLDIAAEPILTRIYRWPLSMPQYLIGHTTLLAEIDARLAQHPGLYLAGAAYRGVGIPDCIREGEIAAQSTLHYLQKLA